MTKGSSKRRRGRPKKSPAQLGEKPHLTGKQWRGLERELRGCVQEWEINEKWELTAWPSQTPSQMVAESAGVTDRSVQGWRKDLEYLRGLFWLVAQKVTKRLEADNKDEPDPTLTERQRAAQLHAFVKQNWTGPVQSPLGEDEEEPRGRRVFVSVDDYVAHLLEHDDVVPMSDQWAKKKTE